MSPQEALAYEGSWATHRSKSGRRTTHDDTTNDDEDQWTTRDDDGSGRKTNGARWTASNPLPHETMPTDIRPVPNPVRRRYKIQGSQSRFRQKILLVLQVVKENVQQRRGLHHPYLSLQALYAMLMTNTGAKAADQPQDHQMP